MTAPDGYFYTLAGQTVQWPMDGVLWHLLASSRGAETRVRLLRVLDERPHNPNELAAELDLDYTTVRYHLDTLTDNNILEKSGDDYGAVYLFTDQFKAHRETFEEILATVAPEEVPDSDDPEGTPQNL